MLRQGVELRRAQGIKAFLSFLTVILCVCSVSASAAFVSFDMALIFEGPGVPTNPSPWHNPR